jgi:hypothetical protein
MVLIGGRERKEAAPRSADFNCKTDARENPKAGEKRVSREARK